jgi:hypothetical protein
LPSHAGLKLALTAKLFQKRRTPADDWLREQGNSETPQEPPVSPHHGRYLSSDISRRRHRRQSKVITF